MNTQSVMAKIGTSRQVAIPKKIYEQLQLDAGDYLEVRLRGGCIVLTPQAFIDRRLAEGLREIKEGREVGPFSNAKDMIKSLRS